MSREFLQDLDDGGRGVDEEVFSGAAATYCSMPGARREKNKKDGDSNVLR